MMAGTAAAQTVEVQNNSSFQAPVKSSFFAYLIPSNDTTGKNFIATLQATGSGKHADVEELFAKMKEKAQEIGANAYRFISFKRDSIEKSAVLIVDAYYANAAALDINMQQAEKGVIYIFGDAEKSNKTYTFKINGDKKEFKGGSYYKHVMKPGEEVKINKGGITGATIWFTWKENRPPVFLTLSGFGLGGAMPQGVVGASFNTGRINYVTGGLGPLLLEVLKPHE